MSYYLKKTRLKGRTYLSIDESFYSNDKKGTAHRCYKSLGSVETHIKNGIADPVAHFQKEVDKLNKDMKESGVQKISDISPIMHLGYFPLKSIMEQLKIKKYVDYFKITNEFNYDLYELLSSLIYARCINPCSKSRTFHDVLPNIYESHNFSYDQLLDGLSFIGCNYMKFVEIFNVTASKKYGMDTSKTYFDCTNFYFEIDREDDFRRKGPSKENRHDPIVGLGLLLDCNQIPIGMKMYPGNESEKPVMREIIDELKKKNNITGRTIHVADKGLNCANNIAFSKRNGDGYIFSKSVKGLSDKEKEWVLLDSDDWNEVRDNSGTVLYRYKTCIDNFPYEVEAEGKTVKAKLKEKRLLTYNPTLASKQRYEINKMADKAKSLSLSKAKREEYGDAGKYISFKGKDGKKATATINQEAIDKDLLYAGYNLIVTSEIDMEDRDIYDTYHNLWRIEESFKIMKSDLDARPVYLQKRYTIQGHFLICYLTVLLERILQFHILKNQYSTSEIFKFMKTFNVVKADHMYINTATSSKFIEELAKSTALPLTDYLLSETKIKSILNCKI